MIDDRIVSALVRNPEAVDLAKDIVLTSKCPLTTALMSYGGDAVRTHFFEAVPDLPVEIILSLVIETDDPGQLLLLVRQTPKSTLDRHVYGHLCRELHLDCLRDAIRAQSPVPPGRFFNSQAVVPLTISSHERMVLAARMSRYSALA